MTNKAHKLVQIIEESQKITSEDARTVLMALSNLTDNLKHGVIVFFADNEDASQLGQDCIDAALTIQQISELSATVALHGSYNVKTFNQRAVWVVPHYLAANPYKPPQDAKVIKIDEETLELTDTGKVFADLPDFDA